MLNNVPCGAGITGWARAPPPGPAPRAGRRSTGCVAKQGQHLTRTHTDLGPSVSWRQVVSISSQRPSAQKVQARSSVVRESAHLRAFVDTLLPAQNGDVLELDELWSFVGSKACQLWLWVAQCRRTRQIVGWTLGDRSLQSACDLRAALAPGYRKRRTHRCCGKEEGETCHVERWFGTLRARTSRLVRRAYSFSKNAENHLDAIHLFITTYNLAILHEATVS